MIPRPYWLVLSLFLAAPTPAQEYLVRFRTKDLAAREIFLEKNGGQLSLVTEAGQLHKWTTPQKVDLSTVPGNRYQDTLAVVGSTQVTWDGTSMAAPFVASALAVIWSTSPSQDFATVRHRLLQGAFAIPSLAGKVATNGRIDLKTVK